MPSLLDRYSTYPTLKLGKRIDERLAELPFGVTEIARRMGLHDSVVSLWRKGVRPVPGYRIEALAAALETTPARLLGLAVNGRPTANGNLSTFCICGALVIWHAHQQLPENERCFHCGARFVSAPTPPPDYTGKDTVNPEAELKASHQGIRYVYELDLDCLMCGRTVGKVVADEPSPARLLVARGLRCAACGGPPMRSEAAPIRHAIIERMEILGARRGRPPKRSQIQEVAL